MNTTIPSTQLNPSLVLQTIGPKSRSFPLRRRRLMIGSSSTCQIIIRSADVAPIHAIVEVLLDQVKIYDMNSAAGTYINDQKVVSGSAKIGDTIRFGRHAFTLGNYQAQKSVPPPLKMLDPSLPPPVKPALPKTFPQKFKQAVRPIFTSEKELAQQTAAVPRVEYPLAKDPHAEFSEYIFEDVEELYPIFDYDVAWSAVEVIVLYQDKIISIDYLPVRDKTYYLVGKNPKKSEVEFAALGKNERFAFLEISHGSTIVYPLPAYQTFVLRDDQDTDPAKLGSKPIQ
ncbi:MAG: FHA domain-containing protein, partial [Bacteriovoracaceae bacterium]|nr:FHA domain-containing protein [Bacteriovoracaceae bacterium]